MGKNIGKRKKRKATIIILFVMIVLLGSTGGAYWYVNQQEEEEDIKVAENQTLMTAQIFQINGNEITFQEAEEADFSQVTNEKEGRGEKAERSSEEDMSAQGNSAKGTDREMPQGGASGGERPSGEMPQGGALGGEMPSENMSDSNRDESDSKEQEKNSQTEKKESTTENQKIYTITGAEQTMLIPVGTSVTTTMGTVTTFSRLAAGDMVKLLLETNDAGDQVIVGVWMIE